MESHGLHLSSSSTSSAIDLTGSPTGLVTAPPPQSPGGLDGSSGVKRRSWAGSDHPLRIPVPRSGQDDDARTLDINDDPFGPAESPEDLEFTPTRPNSNYLTTQPGPSSASLISSNFFDDDDNLRLNNGSHVQRGSGWSGHDHSDPETIPTPRMRKRLSKYGSSNSHLSALRTVSRNIKRMSLRVVNLAGMGLDEHIRLADEDDEKYTTYRKDSGVTMEDDELEQDGLPDLRKSMLLRGRSLGFMGPTNSFRLAMYRFLLYP
jgi:voltage-dependent calcium channel